MQFAGTSGSAALLSRAVKTWNGNATHNVFQAFVQRADQKVLKSFDQGFDNQLTAPTVFDFGAKPPGNPARNLSPQE